MKPRHRDTVLGWLVALSCFALIQIGQLLVLLCLFCASALATWLVAESLLTLIDLLLLTRP